MADEPGKPSPIAINWRRFLLDAMLHVQGGPKKRGHRLMTIILSSLNRFENVFTVRFLRKFAVKWTLNIPPHLAYTTL